MLNFYKGIFTALSICLCVFAYSQTPTEKAFAAQAKALAANGGAEVSGMDAAGAIKYCAVAAGIISDAQAANLAPNMIISPQEKVVMSVKNIPEGQVIGFMANGRMVHMMISVGGGQAAGINNLQGMGMGTNGRWELIDLKKLVVNQTGNGFSFKGQNISVVGKPGDKLASGVNTRGTQQSTANNNKEPVKPTRPAPSPNNATNAQGDGYQSLPANAQGDGYQALPANAQGQKSNEPVKPTRPVPSPNNAANTQGQKSNEPVKPTRPAPSPNNAADAQDDGYQSLPANAQGQKSNEPVKPTRPAPSPNNSTNTQGQKSDGAYRAPYQDASGVKSEEYQTPPTYGVGQKSNSTTKAKSPASGTSQSNNTGDVYRAPYQDASGAKKTTPNANSEYGKLELRPEDETDAYQPLPVKLIEKKGKNGEIEYYHPDNGQRIYPVYGKTNEVSVGNYQTMPASKQYQSLGTLCLTVVKTSSGQVEYFDAASQKTYLVYEAGPNSNNNNVAQNKTQSIAKPNNGSNYQSINYKPANEADNNIAPNKPLKTTKANPNAANNQNGEPDAKPDQYGAPPVSGGAQASNGQQSNVNRQYNAPPVTGGAQASNGQQGNVNKQYGSPPSAAAKEINGRSDPRINFAGLGSLTVKDWAPDGNITAISNANAQFRKYTQFDKTSITNVNQYVIVAYNFKNNQDATVKQSIMPNGDLVLYDPDFNLFAVYTVAGLPKQMFCPSNRITHYENYITGE